MKLKLFVLFQFVDAVSYIHQQSSLMHIFSHRHTQFISPLFTIPEYFFHILGFLVSVSQTSQQENVIKVLLERYNSEQMLIRNGRHGQGN